LIDAITGTPAREEDWTLDALGNWAEFVQMTAGSTTLDQDRTHNLANEITEIDSSDTHVAHDAAGNMTKMPKPGVWNAHRDATYDAWNRLVRIAQNQVGTTYEYDGLNQRIVKVPDGDDVVITHSYYNDRWQCVEERRACPQFTVSLSYIWGGRYVDDLVRRDRTTTDYGQQPVTETLYAVQDANWNVVALAEPDGDVVERFIYDAYGRATPLDPDFTAYSGANYQWTHLYTGRELDPESGLMHYRNRYYHTGLGRFVSRDPIGYGGGINLHEYVRGRAVGFLDPMGEEYIGVGDQYDSLVRVSGKRCEVESSVICATTTDVITSRKGIPDPQDPTGRRKIFSNRIMGEHAVRFTFGACDCECCAVEQWISGYYRLKLPNGEIISPPSSPLPGSGKPIDPNRVQQDSPRYTADPDTCEVHYTDAPGIGLSDAAIRYPGLELDVSLTFEIRVIDTCNSDWVIWSQTHTMTITGPANKPVLRTSLPKCSEDFLKEVDGWYGK